MRRSSRTSARACSCPGVRIDDRITIAADLADAARARAILLVVPAQAVRSATKSLASSLAARTPVIVCAKGIERGTKKFMTEIVAECAPNATPAILSGPSFAADVARGLPTAVTLAARDGKLAQELAQAIGSPSFRPYHSTDMRGVEIGGATKNVLAIAAGVVTGRGLGRQRRRCADHARLRRAHALRQGVRRKTADHDGAIRPRRSAADLLQPAVAQFPVRRQSRPGPKARHHQHRASPKAPSPRRCSSTWRASARSTCRSRRPSRRCSPRR